MLRAGLPGAGSASRDAFLRRDRERRTPSSVRGWERCRRAILRLPGNAGDSRELAGRERCVGSVGTECSGSSELISRQERWFLSLIK